MNGRRRRHHSLFYPKLHSTVEYSILPRAALPFALLLCNPTTLPSSANSVIPSPRGFPTFDDTRARLSFASERAPGTAPVWCVHFSRRAVNVVEVRGVHGKFAWLERRRLQRGNLVPVGVWREESNTCFSHD